MKRFFRICFLVFLIALATRTILADQWDLIRECGVIYYNEDADCYLFHGFESGPYAISNEGTFESGDTVFFCGEVDSTDAIECPGADEYMRLGTIGSCDVVDFGCGRVSSCGVEAECGCVMTEEYGGLTLLNYGGLAYGDSVRVFGRKLYCPPSWCEFSWAVWVDSVQHCGVTPTRMRSWGYIKSLYREK